jgi:hypothetical protein
MKNARWFESALLAVYVSLYFAVSLISTFHAVVFFQLTNPVWLAWALGITFEIGQAAVIVTILADLKVDRKMLWSLIIGLTFIQIMGNMHYAYTFKDAPDVKLWAELFFLDILDTPGQKRVLSLLSGGLLPLIAIGFTKLWFHHVDYKRKVAIKEEKRKAKIAKGERAVVSDDEVQEEIDSQLSEGILTDAEKEDIKNTDTED